MQNHNYICFNVTARTYHWVNVNKYNGNYLSAVKIYKYLVTYWSLKANSKIVKILNNTFIKNTLKLNIYTYFIEACIYTKEKNIAN
jgi:hypothetical protein